MRKKKGNCFAPKCMLFDSQLCICVFGGIVLSSVEGLQIGIPQVVSSGLPVPSRELGLAAQTKEWASSS